jgi:hypothetical protein
MNEAEEAIIRDGLRDIEARLALLARRTPGGGTVRVVLGGFELLWSARTLAVVEAGAPPVVLDMADADLPEELRGERQTTKAVYRAIREVRESRAGPTAVMKAANILTAITNLLKEERSASAVHQACRRLKKLGYIEKAGGYGWKLAKDIDHRPEAALKTAQLHSENAVS